MKNKFNSNLYKKEITNLIKSSIEKLKREYPNYKVLTMSITTIPIIYYFIKIKFF